VSGPFYLLGDTTGTNFFLNQLNASNGLDWFYYNGTFSSSLFRLTSTGAATFSSSVATGSPSGGTAGNWKLGTATSGIFTIGGKIRVEINGVAYDILTT
jgi:hypothetical protein